MAAHSDDNQEKKLLIVPSKGEKLSRYQTQFNNLVKKIESLNQKMLNDKAKLEKLILQYTKKISPEVKRVAELQIIVAKELGSAVDSIKFGARQRQEIEEVILWLLDEAFSVIDPDEETRAFYNRRSRQNHGEKVIDDDYAFKRAVFEDMSFTYGVDIDFDDYDDTPEGLAKLQEKLMEEIDKKTHGSKQKKSKREIEKELKQKKQEDAQLKSIRSVYVSLAKMLHPDTVTDEVEKKEKEELMKKVTVAYNNKNLSELLKLEMQWATSERTHVKNLSDEKLKLYIANLQQQAIDLETEYFLLIHDQRYSPVVDLLTYTDRTVTRKIKEISQYSGSRTRIFEHIAAVLKRNPTKRTVLEYVKEFRLVMDEQEEEEDMDFYY